MRIAITGAHQAIVGGAETYLAWLLRTLVARGHDVAFGFERPAKDPDQAADRELEPLERWNIGALERGEFLAKVSRFRPDIVFLQAFADQSLDLELAQRFRTVLFAHAFYGTCATGWKVHRVPTVRTCTRRFGPACLPVNYLRGCGARNPAQLLRVYSQQRTRSKTLNRVAGLVVASDYMRQVYIQNGVEARLVRVLPYVNLDPDPVPPVPRELPRRVLFLSRFTTGKGGARAIQAVARCQRSLRDRSLHLTMAGDGPELARCQRLAAKLGVAADFPGWIDAERRMALLRDTDVIIVPSLWPEPFGMVGIEAGSVGVPAVAFGTGGIVDWLRPGQNGELAEPYSSRSLALALERALRDPQHHQRLQRGAWQTAQEFSAQRHLTSLETFFQDLSSSAWTSPAGLVEQSAP
ncbi:MAG TPA: glycosyltransferase family 4 protein [Polyangiaceae bacterium]|nr:glycosyltransferase family 4 protein [Polyangiaceae bacterium]